MNEWITTMSPGWSLQHELLCLKTFSLSSLAGQIRRMWRTDNLRIQITKTLHPTILGYLRTNRGSFGKSPRNCVGSKLFKQLSTLNTFQTPCYISADRGNRQPYAQDSSIVPRFLPNQTPPTDSSRNYNKFHATIITNFNRVRQTSLQALQTLTL